MNYASKHDAFRLVGLGPWAIIVTRKSHGVTVTVGSAGQAGQTGTTGTTPVGLIITDETFINSDVRLGRT